MKKKKKFFTKAVEEETKEKIITKEIKPVIIKPEKKIINAVSVVVLDNGSEETKKLLEELQFQKKEYYPETEIVTINEDETDLLDLTKGQYIVYFKKGQNIAKDFLHQLYINMRNGKDIYLLNDVYCINRKIVKTKKLTDITEDLTK